MLAPTPVLRPSPLDISGLFSASIEALKRRFWLLVLIALVPSLVTTVLVIVGVALILVALAAAVGTGSGTAPAGVVAGFAIILLSVVVGGLAQIKAYGMLSLAAYEVAQNQQPTFRGLLTGSRGFLPRMAAVIAIAFAVGAVVYGALVALLVAGVNATATDYRQPGAALLVIFGLFTLLVLVMVPVALFLATKLLYTIPAIALEGRGGMDGLKRSWTLTRGSFWRTLGYYVVAYLAVMAVSYVVSFVSQALVGSSAADLGSIPSGAGPAYLLGRLSVLLPTLAISMVLQLAVSAVTLPFLQAYTTYMFIDQVRRSELPPAAGYGYPSTPGYYAEPGRYYGQPQPGRPAPGYGHPSAPPYAGQPQPGQSYPGQPYPGQAPQQTPGWPGQPTGPQQPGGSPYPPQAWGAPPVHDQQQYPPQAWSRPQNPGDTPDGPQH